MCQQKTIPYTRYSWHHPHVPPSLLRSISRAHFSLSLSSTVTTHPRCHHLSSSLLLCLYCIHCHTKTNQDKVGLFPFSSRPYSLGIKEHFQLVWLPKNVHKYLSHEHPQKVLSHIWQVPFWFWISYWMLIIIKLPTQPDLKTFSTF